ncbi:mannitol dehydrogenase family protein [Sphingomonas bacterium]|uniref:mannitol dehydrogenase family protein n=1 Tax=Sphingomonas bacterium TaxID=1895847 RepID=UPI00157565E0|nr:mannitol dehydrogenase family protein [Sphingomonas bacterium]
MSARLGAGTVDRLSPGVARPGYDWAAQRVGIVHLGIGAFHRAHQAVYTDAAMAAGDRDWGIAGVSLRSASVRDALAPQDGLYTVTQRGSDGESAALIGAIRELVVAPQSPNRVAELLASPNVHLATLTVTEKAYHRRADGTLDVEAVAAAGGTLYHHLADGLARRRADKLPGLTLLSCDNLADNGGVLARGLATWLDRVDPALRRWFEVRCSCPGTMVDRIVPAVTDADLDRVAATIGLRDEGAVVTEPFRQWVIEDRFAGPRPRWELDGAQLVADVAPFEAAKLRMLNGAHSALAYLGLLAGHAFVHQAVADPAIGPTIERLMRDEAAASLSPTPDQDLAAYADALLARFRNEGLPHRLAQIATDGSQKIPQRWLEPLAINAAQGRRSPATLRALAAWMIHVRGTGTPVADPLAQQLAQLWAKAGTEGIVPALFGPAGLLACAWQPDPQDAALLTRLLNDGQVQLTP